MTYGSYETSWPVLKKYSSKFLRKIAMPLGGIGTGTVSLGGRGDLRDWQIMNTPAIGYTPCADWKSYPSFAINAITPDGKSNTLALEGAIDQTEYEGALGCIIPSHGLPRFHECDFLVAYPLAQVRLSDKNFPLEVTLKAFNPLRSFLFTLDLRLISKASSPFGP